MIKLLKRIFGVKKELTLFEQELNKFDALNQSGASILTLENILDTLTLIAMNNEELNEIQVRKDLIKAVFNRFMQSTVTN